MLCLVGSVRCRGGEVGGCEGEGLARKKSTTTIRKTLHHHHHHQRHHQRERGDWGLKQRIPPSGNAPLGREQAPPPSPPSLCL